MAHDGRALINNNNNNNNNNNYYYYCYHRLIIDAAIIHEPTRQIIKYSIVIFISAATSVFVRLCTAPQLVHTM